MSKETIQEFQQAVAKAHWNLNLHRFASAIGASSEDYYVRQKFRDLTLLNNALGQFDPETLNTIILAGERYKAGLKGSTP